MSFRVGRDRNNVYEGPRLVCKCETPADALRIVEAVNGESSRLADLVNAAQAAWHLCQSLLAMREGATDELIVEVRDHLELAKRKAAA